MNKLFGRVSDTLLGLLVPSKEAHALPAERIGCCDFCVCLYRYPDGALRCLNCSCPLCS
jgi:hypothetical protein